MSFSGQYNRFIRQKWKSKTFFCLFYLRDDRLLLRNFKFCILLFLNRYIFQSLLCLKYYVFLRNRLWKMQVLFRKILCRCGHNFWNNTDSVISIINKLSYTTDNDILYGLYYQFWQNNCILDAKICNIRIFHFLKTKD